MDNTRYLEKQVKRDLNEKMVFLGGPRQVGKTTFAKSLPHGKSGYLNWDLAEHRAHILARELPNSPLWVFDELHKYRGWRGYVKGLFDTVPRKQHILVTGSARLDFYGHGGDSLQGRYHYLRMHPFSFKELGGGNDALMALFERGGFPEPLLRTSHRGAKRWSLAYRERLLRDDIQGVEDLSDLGRMELLMMALPERVGSPLSINALREDLQVSHPTISRWLEVFERVYAIFRLSPFGAPKLRAVKKEQKHYQYDWSLVQLPGPRFENMVGSHLLKWVHHQHDTQGRELELQYFRDTDGREVDFIVTENRKPILAVECKLSSGPIDKGINYFVEKYPALEAWQVFWEKDGAKNFKSPNGIRHAPVKELLENLV
jgi:uncharacterized protein